MKTNNVSAGFYLGLLVTTAVASFIIMGMSAFHDTQINRITKGCVEKQEFVVDHRLYECKATDRWKK